MLKDKVDRLQLFSAREILLREADQFHALRQCVSESKRFLDGASIADVLAVLFKDDANRRSVMESVLSIFHVGFLVEMHPQTIDWLRAWATEVGLASRHIVFESTIISRELGKLSGRHEVPTTIFNAFQHERGSANYIEVLIPNHPDEIVTDWIEQEVGTHIGMTLADTSLFLKVRDAFLAEGFEIPAFMEGRPMTNAAVGASSIYFDKSYGGRTVRIELCNCEACP